MAITYVPSGSTSPLNRTVIYKLENGLKIQGGGLIEGGMYKAQSLVGLLEC